MTSTEIAPSLRNTRIADVILADGTWAREPCQVAGFSSDAGWILSRIDEILRGFGSEPDSPAFRLFVDNGNRTDLATALRRSPMSAMETFHQWVSRIVGAQEYCLAFNGVTAWDEPLASYVVKNIVQPIVDVLGIPTRGFDVYLFAGSYGLTPFGVHRDREPSILLHLGPAPKPAMVWASRDYPAQLGSTQEINEFDIKKIETSATHLVLQPGDLLFIPARDPHVMRSHQFSVTLGVIPNTADEKGAIVECVRELADLHGGLDSDTSFFQNALALGRRAADLLAASENGMRHLEIAAESIERRLASNGYLVPPPIERASASYKHAHSFTVPHDYPIFVSEEGDAITVHSRGRFARMRFDPLLFTWLSNNLIQGRVFERGEAWRDLSQRLDETAISSLFEILIRLRALCPVGSTA